MEMRKVHPSAEVIVRMQLVKTVTDFVRTIIGERGILLHCTNGFGYLHMIRELHNHDKFSFYADTNQTILGGNAVKVWYHPGSRYEKGLIPVLDVWWPMEVEECKITKLDPNPEWKRDIRKVIERRRNSLAKIKRAKAAPPKRVLTKYEKEQRERHLAEKARGQQAVRQQCEKSLLRFQEGVE